MIVLGIIILILIIILLLPVGADAAYIAGAFSLRVKAGPFRFGIVPGKNKGEKKAKKPKKPKKAKKQKKSDAAESVEKHTFVSSPTRYRMKDFGISSPADSTSPRFCAVLRYFFVISDESVALSISKMPIISLIRMFLLLPTCKYISLVCG